ncbi:hypothetical protein H0O00_05115, partial [Candidatus Micrarchaeota archaeon]|nr:hypothetical protein [Candidatus Micrarchaeota archaeon]
MRYTFIHKQYEYCKTPSVDAMTLKNKGPENGRTVERKDDKRPAGSGQRQREW